MTIPKIMQRTIAESTLLVDVLSAVHTGGVATYAELSAAIGRDVQREGRKSLARARRIMQREHSVVFGVVRGEGLRRLSHDETIDSSSDTFSRIRRAATREGRRLETVDYEAIDDEHRARLHGRVAALGVIKLGTEERRLKEIESTANPSAPLALGEAIKLFK